MSFSQQTRETINGLLTHWRTFRVMSLAMFACGSKQFKVFYSVVVRLFVNMMNYFLRFKITTKMFFHDKAMFKNIFITIKRMFGRINSGISLFVSCLSAFPIRIIATYTELWISFKKILSSFAYIFFMLCRKAIFIMTFCRTKLPFFLIMKKYRKFSFAVFAGCEYFASAKRTMALMRTIFSSVLTATRNNKFFSTHQAFFNHVSLQIKRLFSVCLSETVKFQHLLRAKLKDIKNLFPISSIIIAENI
jgi:hypothetical protein